LVSVVGFEFTDPPAYVHKDFDQMLSDFSESFGGGSTHDVTDVSGKPIGTLDLITLKPGAAADMKRDLVSELMAEYSILAEQKGTVATIAGETVVTGPVDALGDIDYVWYHDGVLSDFYGDPSTAEDFVTAYLQAHTKAKS
jgi:hypothetical protein